MVRHNPRHRLLMVQLIRESKELLFDKITNKITNRTKQEEWIKIHDILVENGMELKGYKNLRDDVWINAKRRALKAYRNSIEEGLEGKYNPDDVDKTIIDMFSSDLCNVKTEPYLDCYDPLPVLVTTHSTGDLPDIHGDHHNDYESTCSATVETEITTSSAPEMRSIIFPSTNDDSLLTDQTSSEDDTAHKKRKKMDESPTVNNNLTECSTSRLDQVRLRHISLLNEQIKMNMSIEKRKLQMLEKEHVLKVQVMEAELRQMLEKEHVLKVQEMETELKQRLSSTCNNTASIDEHNADSTNIHSFLSD